MQDRAENPSKAPGDRMRVRTILVATGLTIATLALVACGDDEGDGNGTIAGSGGADVGGARASVEKAMQIPDFTLEAPSFDAEAALEGKTILNIPSFSGIPFYDVTDAEMERIATELGAEWIQFPNQGSPDEWAKGIEQAVAQGVDLIHLGGTTPDLNLPQLREAKEAGIPVVLTQIFNTGEPVPGEAGAEDLITAQRTAPFQEAARLEIDWVVSESEGDASILVSTSNEQPPNPGIVGAMEEQLAERCPDCSITIDNVPLTEWTTRITPNTQNALVAEPDINWAIPVYDAQAGFMIAGIQQAGRAGDVKIATYNGSADVLKRIQDDDLVTMDVGESLPWLAWANMDVIMRVLSDEVEPIEDGNEETPLRVFSDANVAEAGVPPTNVEGYGSAYVDGYNQLWGTSLSQGDPDASG